MTLLDYEQKRLDDLVASYAAKGRAMTMWAIPVENFDRDQLFAMIGYLGAQVQKWQGRTQEAHDLHQRSIDDRRARRSTDWW